MQIVEVVADGSKKVSPYLEIPGSRNLTTIAADAVASPTACVWSLTGDRLEPIPDKITHSRSPKDPESWRDIRKSGRVKMTDYHNISEKVEIPFYHVYANHCVNSSRSTCHTCRFDDVDGGIRVYRHTRAARSSSASILFDVYQDVQPFYPLYEPEGLFDTVSQFENDVLEAKWKVSTKVKEGYDPLTEIAEAKKTLMSAKDLLQDFGNIFAAFRRRIGSSPTSQKVGAVAQEWLRFQYAVMPIVYSLEDIAELIGRNGSYFTAKSGALCSFEGQGIPRFPSNPHYYRRVSYNAKAVAVGKARYGSLGSSLGRLSFNPGKTAWELIPYSFVVDWFIGIGDWILIHAPNMVTFSDALEESYCSSIRLTKVDEIFFRDRNVVFDYYEPAAFSLQDSSLQKLTFSEYSIPAVIAWYDAPPRRFELRSRGDSLVKRITTDSYIRSVFKPKELPIRISTSITNWKNWLTSFSLVYLNLLASIRRL